MSISDYIKRTVVTAYPEEWEKLGEENEAVSTFNLSTMKTLQGTIFIILFILIYLFLIN